MKRTTRNIIKTLSAGSLVGAVGALIAFIPNQNNKGSKNENNQVSFKLNDAEAINTKQKNNISENLLSSNINYIALGDSITAGFNSQLGSESPGKLDGDKLTGLSYPAFLAEMIQELLQPGMLQSFENFALSGTRVKDWLYLLGDTSTNFEFDKDGGFLDFLSNLDKNENNLYKGRIFAQYKNFGKTDASDLANVRQKVQEANLITLSLGANDVIYQLPWIKVYNLLTNNNLTDETKTTLTLEILDEFEKLITELKVNLVKFNTLLKQLNPTANINYVGYPMPLLRLSKAINKMVKLPNNQTFSDFVLNKLNATIKAAAVEAGFNYLETYDQDDWEANAKELAQVVFDIHPTAKGYKKMAQDILLKISLGEEYSKSAHHNFRTAQKLVEKWDYLYFEKDHDSFKQQIKFENHSNLDLVSSVLGEKGALKLFLTSALEANPAVINALKEGKLGKLFSNFVTANKPLVSSMANSIAEIFKTFNIQSDGQFTEFLTASGIDADGNNFYDIAETFVGTDYLDNVFKGIQTDIDNLNQEITSEIVADLIYKHALNVDNIFTLFKQFLGSEKYNKHPEKIKQFLKQALVSFLNPKSIANAIFKIDKINRFNIVESQIVNQEINNLIDQIKQLKSLEKIIDHLVDDLFSSRGLYSKQPDFFQMISLFFNNNQTFISTEITLMLNELLAKSENKNSLIKVLKIYLKDELKFDNTVTDQAELKTLTDFAEKFIANLPSSKIFSNFKNKFISAFTNQNFLKEMLYDAKYNTINFSQFDLINLFQINTSADLEALFSIILDTKYSTAEITEVYKVVLKRIDISKIINVFGGSEIDFFQVFHGLLLKNNISVENREKIKTLFTVTLDYLTTNDSMEAILKLASDKLSANAIALVKAKFDSPIVNKYEQQIRLLISLAINSLITSNETKEFILALLDDILNNRAKYVGAKDFTSLLKLLVKNNVDTISHTFDKLLKGLLDNPKLSDTAVNIVFDLAVNKIFEDATANVDAIEKAKFTGFLKKIIPHLTDFSIFKTTKIKLLNFVKDNTDSLLVGEEAVLKKFGSLFSELKFELPEIITTALETIEFNNLEVEDFVNVIEFAIDHLSLEKVQALADSLATEATETTGSETVTKVISVFNAVLKSKTFNAQSDVLREDAVAKNVIKAREIVKQSLTNVLANQKIKKLITDKLGNLLETQLVKLLSIPSEKVKLFVNPLVEEVITNETIVEVIDIALKALLEKAADIEEFTSVEGIVATVFENEAAALKSQLNQLIANVIKNEKIQDFILVILFEKINPEKTYDQINLNTKALVKKLLNVIGNNIDGITVYKELLEIIMFVLSSEELIKMVFSAPATSNSEDDEDDESMGGYAQAIIDQYTTLPVVGRFIVLLKFEEFTNQDWVDLITGIIAEINPNPILNLASDTSDGSTDESLSIKSLKILQNALAEKLETKEINRFKAIVNLFVDKLFDQTSELHQKVSEKISGLTNGLAQVITKKVPTLKSLESDYQTFINKLPQQIFKNEKLKTLLKEIASNFIDRRKDYSNNQIVKTWGEFAKKFADKNFDNLFNNLEVIINDFLTSATIQTDFNNLLERTILSILQINSRTLTPQEKTKSDGLVNIITGNITKLDIYKKLTAKIKEFFKTNIADIADGKLSGEELIAKLQEELAAADIQLINLLDLLEIEELTAEKISEFVEAYLGNITTTELEAAVNNLQSLFKSISTDETTTTETTNVENKALTIISKILNSKYFAKPAGLAIPENVRKNRQKVKEALKLIVENVALRPGVMGYIKNSFGSPMASKLAEALGTSATVAQDFVNAMFDFVQKSNHLKTLINDFIDDVFSRPEAYAGKLSAVEFFDVFLTTTNLNKIKNSIDGIMRELLAEPAVAKFVGELVITKLKLQIPDNKRQEFFNVLTPVLNGLRYSIGNVKIWTKARDALFGTLQTHKLSTFTTEAGQKALAKAIADANLMDFSNILGIIDHIGTSFTNIPAEQFGLLFNFIFQYSPLPENIATASATDYPIFGALNNINKGPVRSRTKLTWGNALQTMNGFSTGDGVNPQEAMKKLARLLKQQYDKWNQNHSSNRWGINKNNPYYKAIYRLVAIGLWFAWETYSREGTRNLFWNRTNSTVEGTLFGMFKDTVGEDITRDVFGDRGSCGWYCTYPEPNTYKKGDLLYMIYYYDGKEKGNGKNRHKGNKETLQHTIFRYIKQGSYDN
ncbi:SGNH/GDSL hydrolase family protein [Candidatus Mycoplasma pogonae]